MLKVILSRNAGISQLLLSQQQPILTCWLLGQPGAAQYHQPLAEIASTQHNVMPASDKFNIFQLTKTSYMSSLQGVSKHLISWGFFILGNDCREKSFPRTPLSIGTI